MHLSIAYLCNFLFGGSPFDAEYFVIVPLLGLFLQLLCPLHALFGPLKALVFVEGTSEVIHSLKSEAKFGLITVRDYVF